MSDSLSILAGIAADKGTPCYVYRQDKVDSQVESLRRAFGDRLRISYAVKANPNRELLRRLRTRVDYLDVSSAGEAVLASKIGWEPAKMSFTGPAKTDDDLQTALDLSIGEVVVESLPEAERLDALAARGGRTQNVLLRLSPSRLPRGFGVNMAGKPTQFGVDEEDMEAVVGRLRDRPNLRLCGFHIYSGTQCLRADSVAENYEIFLDLFRRAIRRAGLPPKRLILGSGLGIPYHQGDEAIDLPALAERINPAFDALRSEAETSETELVLETGRYLVGEAGLYLTRVVNLKQSRGVSIAVCDGGMNHHLGACGHLGSVIHRNYRIFKVDPSADTSDTRSYDLVGPLCTTIDTLGRSVELPELAVGDVIAVRSSGAYGITASPLNFISHAPPKEYLVETLEGEPTARDVSEFSPRSDCLLP